MLRTLKVISYRATHFLSFLIIIMVINVYKLKSLAPDERSAGMETLVQESLPFRLPWRGSACPTPPSTGSHCLPFPEHLELAKKEQEPVEFKAEEGVSSLHIPAPWH